MRKKNQIWHRQFKRASKGKRTSPDGITFHSKAEKNRYLVLKSMMERGEISNLKTQVKYELILPDGRPVFTPKNRVMKYIPDFVYTKDGKEIIEDVKGFHTKEGKIKIAVFEAIYKKTVHIVD